MDGHGIPIVTSNGAGYSKSIFKIPPCEYSIESPESKPFDDSNSNDGVAVAGAVVGPGAGASAVQMDVSDHGNNNASTSISASTGNKDNTSSQFNFSLGKNGNDISIPSETFTRPIPFQNSNNAHVGTSANANVGTGTLTGTMMNAIGQDGNKKWDAILSIRYYDIIQRQKLKNGVTPAPTTQTEMLSIQTTITTVADIQIQIVPTSKPFSSKMNSVANVQNGCERDESLSVSHYNHTITLYAKSFTKEYEYGHEHKCEDGAVDVSTIEDTEQEEEVVRTTMTLEQIQMEQNKVENPTYSWSDVLPQIIFSSNENKYITCVIPHPVPVSALIANGTASRNPPSLSSTIVFSLDWKTKKRGKSTSSRHMNGSSNGNSDMNNTTNTTTTTNIANNMNSIGSPSSSTTAVSSISSSPAKMKQKKHVIDDFPTSKIPLPFYIQSSMEDEEDELVLIEKKDGGGGSGSSSSFESVSLPPTVPRPMNNGGATTTVTATATVDASSTIAFGTATSITTTTTRSPIIHSPRVVSIDTLNSDNYDSGVDDVMAYQKATKLLTQITTICDIHVSSSVATSFEGSTTTDFKTTTSSAMKKKKKKRSVHPLLLAGCTNGSILLIGYKRAKLLTMLHDNDHESNPDNTTPDESDEEVDINNNNLHTCSSKIWNCDDRGVNQMMYMYSPQQEMRNRGVKDCEGIKCGRLITIQRNGQAKFFETEFHTRLNGQEQQHNHHRHPKHHVSVHPIGFLLNQHDEKLPFIHGSFLDFNTVAFLVHPFISSKNYNNRNDTIAQIWYIDDESIEDDENGRSTILVTELKLNDEKLIDFNHGFLPMKKDSSGGDHYDEVDDDDMLSGAFSSNRQSTTCVRHLRANFKLVYDQLTNSLIVNSAISTNASSSFRTNPTNDQLIYNGTNIFVRPFALVWKWRTSTIGFTLLGESFMKHVSKCLDGDQDDTLEHHGRPFLMNHWDMVKDEKNSYSLQNACLCDDASRGLTLAYMSENDDGILQKELYSVGLLSPSPSKSVGFISNVHQPCPIFLTHDSVSYLDSLPASVTKEMALQWKQSQVPSSYRSSHGSLRLACIGTKYGRSIAVAASRGLCVLDLSIGRDDSMYTITEKDGGFPSSCTAGFNCFAQGSSSGVGINHPKWRMFGRSDESSFVVQSMAWWERCNKTNESSEDIILAAIQYSNEGNQQYYFAGWSRRRLGMDDLQVLQSCGSGRNGKRKGIKLPYGFVPDSISLICEPTQTSTRAIALLTSKCNDGIKYILCQLQVKNIDEAVQGNNGFTILGRVSFEDTFYHLSLPKPISASISMNKICGMFIAGAVFRFNLEENNSLEGGEDSTATLGVLHNLGQSVSSLKVSSSEKTCLKNVFNVEKKSDEGGAINVIDKMWLSDIVLKSDKDSTVNAANWSFLLSDGGSMIWSVPFNGIHHGPEGNQPEVMGPLQIFPEDMERSKIFLGPLSTCSDSFLTYSAQDRRKIHRTLPLPTGENFDSHDISIFGMTDCIVGAPSFTPSLIAQLSERAVSRKEKRRNPVGSFKRRQFFDSTVMATRVIVSYVTDQLHRLHNVRSVDRLTSFERMLADIVGLTKSSLSTVQFACIFLSIARQLEHYHLDHLFPLPLQSDTTLSYITVKDLFDISVTNRTLPVASSSLPIFKTTEVLHEHCLDLLHHCITVILNFISANGSTDLWSLREECFFLQQIYNYTVKLEDSFEAQQYHYEDSFETEEYINDEHSTSSNSNAEFDVDESNIPEDSYISDGGGSSVSCESTNSIETDTSYAEIKIVNSKQTPSRIRRIASALKPLFLRSSNTRKDDERAIAEAASTFVTSGFKERSIDASTMSNAGHGVQDISSMGSTSIVQDNSFSAVDISDISMTGGVIDVISKAIISSIFTGSKSVEGRNDGNARRWNGLNQIAVLCNLLQCQNNDRDYELETSMEVIKLISEDSCVTCLRAWCEASASDSEDSDLLLRDASVSDDNDDHDTGCLLMAHIVQLCQSQWSFDDAWSIFDVMISVLARCKTTTNASAVLPFLTLIAVVSSHISEQSEILFGGMEDVSSEVGQFYERMLKSS